ncbi:hypothetical protein IWX76_003540 [Pedobacter sp. CAN_A7]
MRQSKKHQFETELENQAENAQLFENALLKGVASLINEEDPTNT